MVFFEWRHTSNQKIPYYIYPKGGTVFYMGCIYNTWTDKETGEIKDTFSIITTEANSMMEHIHNSKKRMPLIIRKDEIVAWIAPETTAENVSQLMKPYDESKMSSHTISRDASYTNRDRNYPEIKDAIEYNENPQGNLFE